MTYNRATYEEVVLASPGPAKRLSSFGISRLASRYRLFKVRQGSSATSSDSDISSVSGDPVLFVHGNLGDYRQVRSLDSMAFDEFKKGSTRLDYFTIDFREEPSGLSGSILYDQAEFVNDAIAAISRIYALADRKRGDSARRRSVFIVGHSYGGVVAKLSFSLSNHRLGSVHTIVTLGTPHVAPVYAFDHQMHTAYADIQKVWWYNGALYQHSVRSRKAAADTNAELKVKQEGRLSQMKAAARDDETARKEEGSDSAKESAITEEEIGKNSSTASRSLLQQTLAIVWSPFAYLLPGAPSTTTNSTKPEEEAPDVLARKREFERTVNLTKNTVLISLSGGRRDVLVDPKLTSVRFSVLPDRGFSVLTRHIPRSKSIDCDHLAITWCKEVMRAITSALSAISDANKVSKKIRSNSTTVSSRLKAAVTHLFPKDDRRKAMVDAASAFRKGAVHPFFGANDLSTETSEHSMLRHARSMLPLMIQFCCSIAMLAYARQLLLYLPGKAGEKGGEKDSVIFPSFTSCMGLSEQLLRPILGSFLSPSDAKVFFPKAMRACVFLASFGIIFSFSAPFSFLASIPGATYVLPYIPTRLISQSYPALWELSLIYFLSLAIIRLIAVFGGLMQLVFGNKYLRKAISLGSDVWNLPSRLFVGVLSVVAIGHMDTSESTLTWRGLGLARELGSISLAMLLFSIWRLLLLLVGGGMKEQGAPSTKKISHDRHCLSVFLLLLFHIPFFLPMLYRGNVAVQTAPEFTSWGQIFDAAWDVIFCTSFYAIVCLGASLPKRCDAGGKYGPYTVNYYGIEYDRRYGPNQFQAAAMRVATWRISTLERLNNVMTEAPNTVKELKRIAQLEESAREPFRDSEGPQSLDRDWLKKSEVLLYDCRSIAESLTKTLLKLDSEQIRPPFDGAEVDQEVRQKRKSIVRIIQRQLDTADELKARALKISNRWTSLKDGNGTESTPWPEGTIVDVSEDLSDEVDNANSSKTDKSDRSSAPSKGVDLAGNEVNPLSFMNLNDLDTLSQLQVAGALQFCGVLLTTLWFQRPHYCLYSLCAHAIFLVFRSAVGDSF
eukprot:g238.t1